LVTEPEGSSPLTSKDDMGGARYEPIQSATFLLILKLSSHSPVSQVVNLQEVSYKF